MAKRSNINMTKILEGGSFDKAIRTTPPFKGGILPTPHGGDGGADEAMEMRPVTLPHESCSHGCLLIIGFVFFPPSGQPTPVSHRDSPL
jgi:hypothetical protein